MKCFFQSAYLFLCALSLPLAASPAMAADNTALVLVYFHVGNDVDPSQSISRDLFEQHIDFLSRSGAHFMQAAEVVEKLQSNKTLPERTVALTFEGITPALQENALNYLDKKSIPYTVFAEGKSTNAPLLKSLASKKHASIGALPDPYRQYDADAAGFWGELRKSKSRIREITGQHPVVGAYPYGLAPPRDNIDLKKEGWVALFGQHSGLLDSNADMAYLPRFTMTEQVGSLDRLHMIFDAAPLPATDIEPSDSKLRSNPPYFGFSLPEELAHLTKTLSCQSSDGQKAKLNVLEKTRVEGRFANAFPPGRVRINCTATDGTDAQGDQIWRWLGFLYNVPEVSSDKAAKK